jgi:MoaA/NifB/PqqE/SkfB family radical SAM enzyme
LHCYNSTHTIQNELTDIDLFNIIDQAKNIGFNEIHIIGGEPLTRPSCLDLLEYCDEKGLETLLETNATLLTKEIVYKLSALKKTKIRASIDGPEEINNLIRRSNSIKNPYKTSVSNLVYAMKKGIPIQITTSMNKLNYKYLLEMVDNLNKQGLKDVRLRLSMPSNSGYVHWQILKLNSEKLNEISKQVKLIKQKYNIELNSESIVRKTPKQERKCFITPQGNVKPYPFIDKYAGNIKTNSLSQILQKYDQIVFPELITNMMNDYLTELGMND